MINAGYRKSGHLSEAAIRSAEFGIAERASRHLEVCEQEHALRLLRDSQGMRLEPSLAPDEELGDIRRLRSYIERAIHELEIAYPGHALRTLRIAVGRSP